MELSLLSLNTFKRLKTLPYTPLILLFVYNSIVCPVQYRYYLVEKFLIRFKSYLDLMHSNALSLIVPLNKNIFHQTWIIYQKTWSNNRVEQITLKYSSERRLATNFFLLILFAKILFSFHVFAFEFLTSHFYKVEKRWIFCIKKIRY